MKLSSIAIGLLFASGCFMLTSCAEDGLVQTIEPDHSLSSQTGELPVTTSDGVHNSVVSNNEFAFKAPVYLSSGKVNTQEQPEHETGSISIRGKSTSSEYGLGSWEVYVDLAYSDRQNTILGTLHCVFPDYGDEVLLNVNSVNALKTFVDQKGNKRHLFELVARIEKGSGRFENKFLDGKALIFQVEDVLTAGKDNIQVAIDVEGMLYDLDG